MTTALHPRLLAPPISLSPSSDCNSVAGNVTLLTFFSTGDAHGRVILNSRIIARTQ